MRPDVEFAADADSLQHLADGITGRDRPAWLTEQDRQIALMLVYAMAGTEKVAATPGCRPGISWMTMTAGPMPRR